MREAEVEVLWLRLLSQSKKCGWPPQVGKGKTIGSPLELQKECSLANTLILAQ